MWMVVNIVIILLAIPLATLISFQIYPDFPGELRWKIFLAAFLASYPLYFVWLFVGVRKILWGPALIMLGTLIRLTVMVALYFWILSYREELMRSGLIHYLIFIGSFLVFESVSLLVVRYHRRIQN